MKKNFDNNNSAPILDLDNLIPQNQLENLKLTTEKLLPKNLISDATLSGIKNALKSVQDNAKLFAKLPELTLPIPQQPEVRLVKPDFTRAREEAEIRKLTLEQLRNEKKERPKSEPEPQSNNWYSPNSGIGFIKNKPFKFQTDKILYNIFNKIVLNAGRLSRTELLYELGLKENDANDRTLNNIVINDRVKKIRTRTKLKPDELVNNCGNLTLMIRIVNKDETI